MGRHVGGKAGKRAGGKDFAPKVRACFGQALDRVDLIKLMEQALEKDPIGTLRSMAAYAPKQVDITMEKFIRKTRDDLTEEDFELMRSIREKREASEPVLIEQKAVLVDDTQH